MKATVKWLLILGFLVGIVVVLKVSVFKPVPISVTVHEVDRGTVEDTVVNSRAGTIKSRQRAEMSPGISGLVTEIAVVKGSRVSKGDLLLSLDDAEYRAQVQLAEAALTSANAAATQARLEAEQAERDWVRTQALAENEVVSENLIDQDHTRALIAEAAHLAAKAKILEMEAALESALATLAKTTMEAAFDGVVLDVATEVGEWISPSPPGVFIPPVVDLINPSTLYLSAPIDEADVARLKLELPVRITLDAFRGQEFKATLNYISSYVETKEEQNRTLEIEAVFAETKLPANLLPGLSADLEIILDSRKDVLRIPTYALLEGSRVMVIHEGRLKEKTVEIGLQNWKFTEIQSGLDAGEKVVVSLDRPEVVAGVEVVITEEAQP